MAEGIRDYISEGNFSEEERDEVYTALADRAAALQKALNKAAEASGVSAEHPQWTASPLGKKIAMYTGTDGLLMFFASEEDRKSATEQVSKTARKDGQLDISDVLGEITGGIEHEASLETRHRQLDDRDERAAKYAASVDMATLILNGLDMASMDLTTLALALDDLADQDRLAIAAFLNAEKVALDSRGEWANTLSPPRALVRILEKDPKFQEYFDLIEVIRLSNRLTRFGPFDGANQADIEDVVVGWTALQKTEAERFINDAMVLAVGENPGVIMPTPSDVVRVITAHFEFPRHFQALAREIAERKRLARPLVSAVDEDWLNEPLRVEGVHVTLGGKTIRPAEALRAAATENPYADETLKQIADREAEAAEQAVAPKRGRGRPKGSKSKPKEKPPAAPEAGASATPIKTTVAEGLGGSGRRGNQDFDPYTSPAPAVRGPEGIIRIADDQTVTAGAGEVRRGPLAFDPIDPDA